MATELIGQDRPFAVVQNCSLGHASGLRGGPGVVHREVQRRALAKDYVGQASRRYQRMRSDTGGPHAFMGHITSIGPIVSSPLEADGCSISQTSYCSDC
jgi:hypothetical protein